MPKSVSENWWVKQEVWLTRRSLHVLVELAAMLIVGPVNIQLSALNSEKR